MENKHFTVSSKKDLPITLLVCALFEAGIIAAYVVVRNTGLLIFAIAYSVLFALLILATASFSIRVDNLQFRVRSKWGRRYDFLCSDIEKVSCHRRRVNHVLQYFISIKAVNNEFAIEWKSSGFKQLASYLLEQYSVGNINKSAVSPKTIHILKQYASGTIQRVWKTDETEESVSKPVESPTAFNSIETAMALFRSVGCEGRINCIFIAYKSTATEFVRDFIDSYDGYIINRTEDGFGMMPLAYKKATITAKPEYMDILPNHYYFIPNNQVKEVVLKPYHRRVRDDTMGITLYFEDRTIYLVSKLNEPSVPYHKYNLETFINANSQRNFVQ